MRIRCVLSQTASGDVKSKVVNQSMSTLTLDCYLTPSDFALILEKYMDKEFDIEIK